MTALMGLDTRLRLARLLVVTDTMDADVELSEHAAALYQYGADIIQVRDPDAEPEKMLRALEVVQSVTLLQPNRLLSTSDDVELAREFSADMIVLPALGLDASLAHARLHTHALVGRIAHDSIQLRDAATDPQVNFVCLGPIFDNGLGRVPGLALVAQAAEQLPVNQPDGKPWFAGGGISPETLDSVIEAGARRVVVSVPGGTDPAPVKDVSERMRQAWVADPSLQNYAFSVFGMGTPRAALRQPPAPW